MTHAYERSSFAIRCCLHHRFHLALYDFLWCIGSPTTDNIGTSIPASTLGVGFRPGLYVPSIHWCQGCHCSAQSTLPYTHMTNVTQSPYQHKGLGFYKTPKQAEDYLSMSFLCKLLGIFKVLSASNEMEQQQSHSSQSTGDSRVPDPRVRDGGPSQHHPCHKTLISGYSSSHHKLISL